VKSKFHIVFLASWFPSKKNIYDGDFIERHAKAVSLKHVVKVIFVEGLVGINQIEKEVTNNNNLQITRIYFPKKHRIYNQFMKFWLYIKEINKLHKIDLIHVNVTFPVGIIALYFKKVKQIPFVVTEHWTGYLDSDPTKISFFRKLITKIILKNASYLLPVSDSLGNSLYKLGVKCKTKVIRNVIDFEVFNLQNLSKNKVVKFLHISNLSTQKNSEGIINVSDKLWRNEIDFQLHIGGNGDLAFLNNNKSQSKYADKLFVFGDLSQQEVAEKMNQCDCFVLFSRYENQPCVQIESFACGLPVIATDVGGVKEVFPSGFGKIIESENEENLYDAMKIFVENKMDIKSKETIHQFAKNHFSMEKISEDFDVIYREIIR
jgi:glycosyltransferase involved in cell wall biosynthesis